MCGFILETVEGSGCKRLGKIFWTESAARFEANHLVNRGRAAMVRILTVNVAGDAMATITKPSRGETL